MVLAELRELAGELKIGDTAGMRKGELIAAIKERQGSVRAGGAKRGSAGPEAQLSFDGAGSAAAATGAVASGTDAPAPAPVDTPADSAAGAPTDTTAETAPRGRRRRTASRPAGSPAQPAGESAGTDAAHPAAAGSSAAAETATDTAAADTGPTDTAATDTAPADTRPTDTGPTDTGPTDTAPTGQRRDGEQESEQRSGRNRDGANRDRQQGRNTDRANDRNTDRANDRNTDRANDRNTDRANDRNTDRANDRANDRDDDDEDGGGRGRRGRRFRDRNRRGRDRRDGGGGQAGGGGTNAQPDTEVRDDDVLLPVAGIIDVLDNYAFVRTSGYLSGPNDVYVSLSMVRRHGLRRGDNVTGVVRQPRDGEQQRQKFNPLVRVDSINGLDPDQAKDRPEFTKLTPLYPNERMRLETEPSKLTTRVIDLVMPIGKGQRALIVSPPKAGKTMVLQAIANAITTNNPECHLMVVLVDERPEEVTDMQRSVKGEVIASTFDRPPSDHTTVAELSIERAKRLVEMGHDVVVLLDSITRLGRAYNLAAPASGRILSGGVDSTALYPPKRFLGAARNIEDGGSLTILATALVETGSTMDTVIFEEFKGTGNAELKLDRKLADKRVFPAVDVADSGTRKEELLLAPDEMAVMVKLRRVLSALDDQQALDLVLTQLRKTRTNIEFLMQVAKNTPNQDERD
ncbi:MAG: transcription termination factor Rho [Pseudonocardia sp.]